LRHAPVFRAGGTTVVPVFRARITALEPLFRTRNYSIRRES
jgi:hypothetical protein